MIARTRTHPVADAHRVPDLVASQTRRLGALTKRAAASRMTTWTVIPAAQYLG